MDSILQSIKKMLGISEEYMHFDTDITMHINTVLFILTQMGVGQEGLTVTGSSETWQDFLIDESKLNAAKTYVYLKVKLIFDPPLSSAVTEAINRTVSELEWRLLVAVEPEEEIQNG